MTSKAAAGRQPSAKRYLRQSVKVEPLVGRWHAWHHLVAPAQLAMNLAYRFIPLLESFVSNPGVHEAASRDPLLYGGAFVDLPASKIEAVQTLLNSTREEASTLLELAGAIRQLDITLRANAAGQSLDQCYAAIPSPLRGLVEFSYDLSHRAGFRFRETLLQRAFAGSSRLQEFMLHDTPDAQRAFFLNTPRLPEPDEGILLRIPFTESVIDELARARFQPVDVSELGRRLGVHHEDRKRFADLFTSEVPKRRAPHFHGRGVRVRYFGHACVLIQTSDTAVLVDPTFAYTRGDDAGSLTLADLPDQIDFVVLSHNHQDHLVLEALLQLRYRIGAVIVPRNIPGSLADPSAKLLLESIGVRNVLALDEMEGLDIPGGRIVSLPFPGEHCDLDVRSRQCVDLSIRGRRFLFLVDSDAVDAALYARLQEHVRDVDLMFLGMECHGAPLTWLYGPLLLQSISRGDDFSRRGSGSNCERAWNVISAIGCSRLWVYAMGMERWNRHLLGLEYSPDSVQICESNALLARCSHAGIDAERLQGCREMVLPPTSVRRSSIGSVLEQS